MNVAKVRLRWILGETINAATVLHVKRLDSAPVIDATQALAIAQKAFTWFTEAAGDGVHEWLDASSLWCSSVALSSIEVERVEPTFEELLVFPAENWAGRADTSGWPGALTSIILPYPPQCCWLVRTLTSVDDRRSRGRVYFPSTLFKVPAGPDPSLDELAAGVVPIDVRDVIGKQAAHLHWNLRTVTATEGEYQWCVYSRVNGTALSVSRFLVSDVLRTQRRRTVYPGTVTDYELGGNRAA